MKALAATIVVVLCALISASRSMRDTYEEAGEYDRLRSMLMGDMRKEFVPVRDSDENGFPRGVHEEAGDSDKYGRQRARSMSDENGDSDENGNPRSVSVMYEENGDSDENGYPRRVSVMDDEDGDSDENGYPRSAHEEAGDSDEYGYPRSVGITYEGGDDSDEYGYPRRASVMYKEDGDSDENGYPRRVSIMDEEGGDSDGASHSLGGTYERDDYSEGSGEINVLSMHNEGIEAMYHSHDGRGLHIISQKIGEAEAVELRNERGEVIITVAHPNPQVTHVAVGGQEFVMMHSSDGRVAEYAVSAENSHVIQAVVQNNDIPDTAMLENLDEDTTGIRERAMQELLGKPEISTIEEAAFALGKSGVTGTNNPAAMVFYALAMKLSKPQDPRPADEQDYSEDIEEMLGGRYKRRINLCRLFRGRSTCPSNGACCRRCPESRENHCRGMCGPGCTTCWWFVCGTCCYHQGCYEHDVCCRDRGADSLACRIPIGFTCRGYRCPRK